MFEEYYGLKNRLSATLLIGIVIFCFLLLPLVHSFDLGWHEEKVDQLAKEKEFDLAEIARKKIKLGDLLVDIYTQVLRLADKAGKILDSAVIAKIVKALGKDFFDQLHFDNKFNYEQIAAHWKNLEDMFKKALDEAKKENDVQKALLLIGMLLHAVEDFYAHSNWVDFLKKNNLEMKTWDQAMKEYLGLQKYLKEHGDEIYTGYWPKDKEADAKKINPSAKSHDDLNKDDPTTADGAKYFDEAFDLAKQASREWLRKVKDWLGPGFWKDVRSHNPIEWEETYDWIIRGIELLGIVIGHWKYDYEFWRWFSSLSFTVRPQFGPFYPGYPLDELPWYSYNLTNIGTNNITEVTLDLPPGSSDLIVSSSPLLPEGWTWNLTDDRIVFRTLPGNFHPIICNQTATFQFNATYSRPQVASMTVGNETIEVIGPGPAIDGIDKEFLEAAFTLYNSQFIDWPSFGHDVANRRCSAASAPDTNETLWTYTTGDYVTSSPAISGDYLAISSHDRKIYVFNATTGNEIWNVTLGYNQEFAPAIADGMVFTGSLYALNVTTGALIWNYTTGILASSPVISDGIVYIGSDDRKVYALNETTGESIWNYTTGGQIYSTPALDEGMVYVGSNDRYLYALNSTNGMLIWSFNTTGEARTSSPAVDDGIVYIAAYTDMYAVNATTGTKIWNFTTGAEIMSSVAVAEDKIFIGSRDGKLYALNATDGTLVWSYLTGGQVNSSPAVADGKVFVGSSDSKVYAFNATTGEVVWSYSTSGAISSSPAIARGKVFVGSSDSKIYAIADHNVDIGSVTLPRSVVGSGSLLSIETHVANRGYYVENSSVRLYANITLLTTFANVTFLRDSISALTFTWNSTGFAKGSYTITAMVDSVPGEMETEENIASDGQVILTITGDINGDYTVDIYDAILLSNAFNTYPGHPNWNPNADINSDNVVDIYDAILLANHYNQHYP